MSGIARGGERHAHPGGASHRNCAEERKDLSPSLGRHADLREAQGCVITHYGGRCGKDECDRGAEKWRAQRCNGDLSDGEDEGAGGQTDEDRADLTRAAAVGGKARGHCREKRNGQDREREQQPAQKSEADEAENNANDNDHGGGSRDKGLTATPSTTSTASAPK